MRKLCKKIENTTKKKTMEGWPKINSLLIMDINEQPNGFLGVKPTLPFNNYLIKSDIGGVLNKRIGLNG